MFGFIFRISFYLSCGILTWFIHAMLQVNDGVELKHDLMAVTRQLCRKFKLKNERHEYRVTYFDSAPILGLVT